MGMRIKSRRIGLSGGLHAWGRRLATLATITMAVCATAAPAWASSQSGTVTSVSFVQNGRRVLFWMSGAKTGAVPSCDCCGRWEIYVGDAYGQALLSIIMTAYASGKNVSLTGAGTCQPGALDTEGVAYVQTY